MRSLAMPELFYSQGALKKELKKVPLSQVYCDDNPYINRIAGIHIIVIEDRPIEQSTSGAATEQQEKKLASTSQHHPPEYQGLSLINSCLPTYSNILCKYLHTYIYVAIDTRRGIVESRPIIIREQRGCRRAVSPPR